MGSLYASVTPHFTQDLLTPELKVAFHDEGGSWPFVAASLALRLPLRGIEWRNLVGATKRIERLPLTFVPQSQAYHPPQHAPLVALYLVKCEDMEHYRAGAKARLAAWVERMNAARVEWMVLYVPLGTRARAGGGGNHSVYKKIFDKIRADFAHKRPSFSGASIGGAAVNPTGGSGGSSNSSGIGGGSNGGSSPGTPGSTLLGAGERICKIEILEGNSIAGGAPGQQQQHESQWSELLLRLRHCIMDAFQVKCYQYEEEVRVLDAKRNANAAGWDFGAFFLAKERLALMYQQTYLLDDAIRHFDELDAIFMNLNDRSSLNSQDETDKYSIRASDPIFATAPLAVDLSATQLEIAANRATPLVIQLHCFCRQIRALYLMGNFPQLIERATAFISSFFLSLKHLYETTSAIEAHQPFQWAIGACVEVAYACELSWNGHDYQVSSASVPVQITEAISPEVMSRHLGDILYLARRILVRFSRSVSEAPLRLPLPEEESDKKRSLYGGLGIDTEKNTSAWYQWLQQVFASRSASESLERCVWEMSHLASLHFSRAGRHRFAVFLGGECARYHFRHREFESASRLFRSHSRQCEEDKWWKLVGDCVRNICESELELGRASEAVAACFSLLSTTQEAKAEIGREYLENMMHTLVQRLDQRESAAKLRMGSLIKPSLMIETMQSAGSDLVFGEVRLKVKLENCFPAGVHIEKICVRFSRSQVPASDLDSVDKNGGGEDRFPVKRASEASDSKAHIPCHHNPLLGRTDSSRQDEGEVVETETAKDGANQIQYTPLEGNFGPVTAGIDLQDKQREESDVQAPSSMEIKTPVVAEEADPCNDDVFEVLESNVYLCEKTTVELELFQSGVDVGSYVCTGVDCVLAGNTFSLLSGSDIELRDAEFEIPRRESTLRISIAGPPLLAPQSVERICVSIRSQCDAVVDGVLDFESVGGLEELGPVQFLNAELQTSSISPGVSVSKRNLMAQQNDLKNRLLLSIPSMAPGEVLVYQVWLWVGDVTVDGFENEGEGIPTSTVSATLRYQHSTPSETITAIRRADTTFKLLRPLEESVRLKHIHSKVIAAVALTCNNEYGLVIRDYRLESGACSDDTKVAIECGSNSCNFTIIQDPNAHLRNTRLQPGETIHFAFTLADGCGKSISDGGSSKAAHCTAHLPDEAHLALDLQYDSSACVWEGNGASDGTQLTPQISAHSDSLLVVRLPFAKVRGARYRIEVEPKIAGRASAVSSRHEFAVGEEVAFHVVVREVRENASAVTGIEERDVVLCLDEASERDWILLGKQRERFRLHAAQHQQESLAGGGDTSRCFSTLKRLVSTRVGRVHFPSFHLRDLEEQRTPTERITHPQRAMQVIVR